jgi:hypothetical protein
MCTGLGIDAKVDHAEPRRLNLPAKSVPPNSPEPAPNNSVAGTKRCQVPDVFSSDGMVSMEDVSAIAYAICLAEKADRHSGVTRFLTLAIFRSSVVAEPERRFHVSTAPSRPSIMVIAGCGSSDLKQSLLSRAHPSCQGLNWVTSWENYRPAMPAVSP